MHTMCIQSVQYHVCYICPIKNEDKEEKVNLIRDHLEDGLQLH